MGDQLLLAVPWAQFCGSLNPNSSRMIPFTLVHQCWLLCKVKEALTHTSALSLSLHHSESSSACHYTVVSRSWVYSKMGKRGTQGEEGCRKMSVLLLLALPVPEDGDNHWQEGVRWLVAVLGQLVPKPCKSFPPIPQQQLDPAQLCRLLFQPIPQPCCSQPAHRPRRQNSVFPPLSLPCTSLSLLHFPIH